MALSCLYVMLPIRWTPGVVEVNHAVNGYNQQGADLQQRQMEEALAPMGLTAVTTPKYAQALSDLGRLAVGQTDPCFQ